GFARHLSAPRFDPRISTDYIGCLRLVFKEANAINLAAVTTYADVPGCSRRLKKRTPHPPLRALCQHQPRREHRDGPRTIRRHPACRRPATAARWHAGCATCAALLVPALWRSHDRHRGVRARLPAEVAPDAEQDRHVMSQTFP